MVLLKNGRFWLGNISIPFPEGFYLNPNTDVEIDTGVEFTDRDQSWRMQFMLDRSRNDAKADAQEFYEESLQRHCDAPAAISIGELSGFVMTYKSSSGYFADMTFDVGKAEVMDVPEWENEEYNEDDNALFHVLIQAPSNDKLLVLLNEDAQRILESVQIHII